MAKPLQKFIIQNLVNRYGYYINRFFNPRRENDAFAAMQRLLATVTEPIIFDVGAHHGHITQELRALFPNSKIYAFEPFAESYAQLQANTKSDPKIKTFNFGLSDRNGKQNFHTNLSAETNSLLATDNLAAQTWVPLLLDTEDIVEAEFKTLDSVLAELKISRVDLLKLDVQGAESLVLQGALGTCEQQKIQVIYSEIITQPTYQEQKRFDQALSGFYDRGFDLYNIYNPSLTREGRLRQVDVIFTRQPTE